jgi:uncharacterized membrane protein
MHMNRNTLVLAGSVAAALGLVPLVAHAAAPPAGKEACYGIAMKGHNDCAAGVHDCSGKATADYDVGDFKYVPTGTCAKMTVHGHKGSMYPA